MAGAGAAIASLVVLQLFAKLINFALNVLVVRATGATLFGVSAVPLALLLSTIQFLSREGVRGACQRIDVARLGAPPDALATRADLARVVNLSWAVLPLALGVAPLCAAAAVWRGYDGVESEQYRTLVVVFGLAAVLELLVEPAYNLVVVCDKLHVRAAVNHRKKTTAREAAAHRRGGAASAKQRRLGIYCHGSNSGPSHPRARELARRWPPPQLRLRTMRTQCGRGRRTPMKTRRHRPTIWRSCTACL
jgi:hypothetical protein